MVNLVIAGLFEVGWALGMKFNQGFTRLWPSAATLACMAGSLAFLSMALKNVPMGTAYAVWTGIGAAGTALVGIALFSESHSPARLFCISLIVGGVVGLQLATRRSNRPGTAAPRGAHGDAMLTRTEDLTWTERKSRSCHGWLVRRRPLARLGTSPANTTIREQASSQEPTETL
jgi:quaternary ammonium compound-resistance protein SugE